MNSPPKERGSPVTAKANHRNQKPSSKRDTLKPLDFKNLEWTAPPAPLFVVLCVGLMIGAWSATPTTALDPPPPWVRNGSFVSAFYVLGDSSVDCGDNTLFYPLLHRDLSLHPCDGSDKSLVPHFLAEKMGIPETLPLYGQNGPMDGLLRSLNFGSAVATILSFGSRRFQSLNQQLRQVLETFQLIQLQLPEDSASEFMRSSITYLSFGKDDYIDLYLQNYSTLMIKFSGEEFAHILVDQMSNAIMSLYNANARKIICVGISPLGCTPRLMWEWSNRSLPDADRSACVGEVNDLILEYNRMLEERIGDLNMELPDVEIVYCDVYRGIMQIINNHELHGFKEVRRACCGMGWNGASVGCLSLETACSNESAYVWWDLYNPTKAVNHLLAESAWSGRHMMDICRPAPIQNLMSTASG